MARVTIGVAEWATLKLPGEDQLLHQPPLYAALMGVALTRIRRAAPFSPPLLLITAATLLQSY